jgi:hypothetical protein
MDAMKIVGHFAKRGRDERITLALQRQLVDERMAIHDTDVGKLLFEQLDSSCKQLQEMAQASQCEITAMFESGKARSLEAALELQNTIWESMRPLEIGIAQMKKNSKEVSDEWEEILKKETETVAREEKVIEKQMTRLVEELSQLHNRSRSPSPCNGGFLTPPDRSVQRTTRSASSSSGYSNLTHIRRSLTPNSAASEASLLQEIEELGHQQELIEGWKHSRPDSRYTYTQQQGHNTAWGVVGKGLAVAQVVAAMACTIM